VDPSFERVLLVNPSFYIILRFKTGISASEAGVDPSFERVLLVNPSFYIILRFKTGISASE